jgi:hypothetical protein
MLQCELPLARIGEPKNWLVSCCGMNQTKIPVRVPSDGDFDCGINDARPGMPRENVWQPFFLFSCGKTVPAFKKVLTATLPWHDV